MTESQLDELALQIGAVLNNHFKYLDLGNPEIPQAIDSAKEDIKEVVDTFVDKYIKGR